jgi:cytochrome c peroxidase
LRNVALTAPYMHDGSFKTLDEAIEYELYYTGSRRGAPIIITPAQKSALLSFLRSLNDLPDSEGVCKAAIKMSSK